MTDRPAHKCKDLDPSTAAPKDRGSNVKVEIRECDLLIVEGPGAGRVLRCGRGSVTVGKAVDNDVVLEDPSVSRHHLVIRQGSLGHMVRDLGSRNGTRVNGTQIKQAYLEPGALIALGDTVLTFQLRRSIVPVPASVTTRFRGIIGHSLKMRQLFGLLEAFAPSNISILLHGETGTGKELIARAIHDESPRSHEPFGVLDCAATDPTLLASALFGHSKGAFTGADAARKGIFRANNGGTVFIDEIGDLPLDMQPKLLRFLEQRTIQPLGSDEQFPLDVRIVSATHRDLGAMISAGQFREDLKYRLSGVVLGVPPLRERSDDIVPLSEHFVNAVRPGLKLTDEAKAVLVSQRWPGNVRQIKNVLERSALVARDGHLDASGLILDSESYADASTEPGLASTSPQSLEQVEQITIESALRSTKGHREQAARILGISSKTLREKIKKYGLSNST